jgi:hypothetical protein
LTPRLLADLSGDRVNRRQPTTMMIRHVEEDAALDPPIRPKKCLNCKICNTFQFTYRIPTLRELFDRDKRLLRAILSIAIIVNVPIGRYILCPFVLFSTWIHELFHGMAALSVGGSIEWLNIYPDGSGLAYTNIPDAMFQRAWVAAAGYQGTAVVGGIMLMFRRTNVGVRIVTGGIGLAMLLTCVLFVRNAFGLAVLLMMGILITFAGWYLPLFWVGELYALLAATTCLNAITSIQVLFFVTESSIGGVSQSSDAMTMQEVTMVRYQLWALIWLVLAFWMTAMGVFLVFEAQDKGLREDTGRNLDMDTFHEDRPLTTELT